MTFALCQARSAINWHRRRQLQVRKVEKRKNRQRKLRKTEREGEEKTNMALRSRSPGSRRLCADMKTEEKEEKEMFCVHTKQVRSQWK